MKQEPPSPRAEFLIAIVGPLASLVLAGFFWLIWRALAREGPDPSFAAVALYLTGLNMVVAVFNLLPAFPLDGGRVLGLSSGPSPRISRRPPTWRPGLGLSLPIY